MRQLDANRRNDEGWIKSDEADPPRVGRDIPYDVMVGLHRYRDLTHPTVLRYSPPQNERLRK